MKKNVASQVIGAQMVSATDGSAFTGAVTVYVTGDGGTQAVGSVGSGACTHEGNGFHSYAPAQSETNYNHIAFTFTGTGAVPATVQVFTGYPQTGDAYAETTNGTYGLSAIENLIDGAETALTDIQSRIPAALVGGLMSSNVTAVSTDTTAADNLEAMLDGTGGVNLNLQQLIITAGDALPNIVLAGSGTSDGIAFTRTGSGNPFDSEFAAQIQSECNDAIIAYDPATGTEVGAISTTIGVAGAGLTEAGGTGDQLTAIPWNAAWDTEVQSECADALTAYDPPTNAEMEARTPTAAQLAYIVSNAADGVPVTFSGGTTTTAVLVNVDGAAASSVDDFYNGRILVFNASTLDMQVTDITDYVGSTKTATITAVTTAVTSSHTANMK